MDQRDDRSFRLDRKARSFAPSDFGLGDVPWFVVAMVVVMAAATALTYTFDQVGRLLPPNLRLIAIGFVLGLLVGFRISDWSARRFRAKATDLGAPDA